MGMRKDSLNPSNNQTGFERREKRKKKKQLEWSLIICLLGEARKYKRGVKRKVIPEALGWPPDWGGGDGRGQK